MTVGEKIQFYRKNLGLSQEELGQKLHVSRQTVSFWEKDQTVPTIDNLALSILLDEQRESIAEYDYMDFDGETKEHFRSRVRQVMNELEVLNCETVALFTHAGWMRGMLDAVLGT